MYKTESECNVRDGGIAHIHKRNKFNLDVVSAQAPNTTTFVVMVLNKTTVCLSGLA